MGERGSLIGWHSASVWSAGARLLVAVVLVQLARAGASTAIVGSTEEMQDRQLPAWPIDMVLGTAPTPTTSSGPITQLTPEGVFAVADLRIGAWLVFWLFVVPILADSLEYAWR